MNECASAVTSLRGDALWGAKAIAGFAHVSVDTVYAWAVDSDAPVYKPGGRYFAVRSELLQWLKKKPQKPGMLATQQPNSTS